MKKKIITIMSVGVLMAASMTGCGQDAEATESTAVSEETTITESTEEITVEDSSDSEIEQETTETEVEDETENTVLNDDVEIDTSIPSKELGNFIIFDEKKVTDYDVNLETFNTVLEADYTIERTIPVYYTSGNQAGYMKGGTSIHVVNGTDEWLRFDPKTEGITVPFFLVRVEDVLASTTDEVKTYDSIDSVSAEDVKEMIVDALCLRDYVTPTFLDAATSDMECITFSIDKFKCEDYKVRVNLFDEFAADMSDYQTYYVECVENEENNTIECTVWYKDLFVYEVE